MNKTVRVDISFDLNYTTKARAIQSIEDAFFNIPDAFVDTALLQSEESDWDDGRDYFITYTRPMTELEVEEDSKNRAARLKSRREWLEKSLQELDSGQRG